MRHRLEYISLLATSLLVRSLPGTFFRRLLGGGGLLFYFLSRRYREVALQNLLRIHPDPQEGKQRRAIARASFRNLGNLLHDILELDGLPWESIEKKVEVIGWEHLVAAYGKGKGVLLFSAHFGNWELVPLLQGYRGFRLNLITRPLDNPLLEQHLKRIRSQSGNRVLHKSRAMKKCLQAIRAAEGIAIVIDQSVPGEQAVNVDFLGRKAGTTQTLAKLALRYGCPIVPVFSLPLPSGRYRVVYEREVVFSRSGDEMADIRDLTQLCTRVIERYVRERPELWFWMHRRWRVGNPARPLPSPRRASVDA